MTLLRIDSSARQQSVSRQLTSRFLEAWRAHHPGDTVIDRDLAKTTLPPVTDEWSATYGDPSLITPAQQRYLSLSDALIAELYAADVIVIGAPMYNLSISAELKGWIDHVVRRGKTIAYDEKGPRGLLQGRSVIVASSRGGSYAPGSPRASADFQEPYLREVLRSLGLTDVTFVHAENQARPALAERSRASARDRLTQLATQLTPEVVTHVRCD